MKPMAILRQIALLMALVAFAAGSLPSTASAQTSCSNTPLTSGLGIFTRLLPSFASGLCDVTHQGPLNAEWLRFWVIPRVGRGEGSGRVYFHVQYGGVLVVPSSLVIDGDPVTIDSTNGTNLSSEVLDEGAHTVVGTVVLDGTLYTMTMQYILRARDVTVESVVITGGAFDELPDSGRQPSANKSAAAAFGRASNFIHMFVTQTQTQDRFIHDSEASTENGNGPASSVALAEAYGKTIRRPHHNAGQTAWHSKDLLNHYRKQQASERRQKEQRAMAGLQQLGVNPTVETTQPKTGQSKWDFWAAGGLSRVDSSRTGNSFDGDLTFARSGFDYLVTNSFLVGAFGGYDKADAQFESLLIDLNSRAKIAGGYFGYKMTRAMTGLPVDLVLDGQGSYAWIDYDVHDNSALTDGDFDAKRFAGSLSLTAVFLQSLGQRGNLKVLPKVGVTYVSEKQDAYTDSGGNEIGSQTISLGQLTFGSSVFVPIRRGVEIFGRVEGQWDFNDIGVITTSTGSTYKPDDFGVVVGGGVRAELDEKTVVRVEGATQGLGRKDYNQSSVLGRIDFKY
ncbi:MAG: autotransporter outer membrane beta-barrel domain-containing protein [Pseudomonadota bacterium]